MKRSVTLILTTVLMLAATLCTAVTQEMRVLQLKEQQAGEALKQLASFAEKQPQNNQPQKESLHDRSTRSEI